MKASINYCPQCGCTHKFEELDCTAFYCHLCKTQWQIEHDMIDVSKEEKKNEIN